MLWYNFFNYNGVLWMCVSAPPHFAMKKYYCICKKLICIEAESFPGPSVIVAYTPCTSHGIRLGMHRVQEEMKRAVQSGYWNLYRYDPRNESQPLTVDSKAPSMDFMDFLDGENRYASLYRSFPENAAELFALGSEDAAKRYEKYRKMEENQKK